jgi:hypothetical protein
VWLRNGVYQLQKSNNDVYANVYVMSEERPRSLQSGKAGSNSETWEISVMIWAAISWYSVGLIINFLYQITA